MKMCVQCKNELSINPKDNNQMACKNPACVRFGLLTAVSYEEITNENVWNRA